MSDITMCNGKGCPISYKCYRHNAKATPFWQSYFVEAPYKNGECKEYWPQTKQKATIPEFRRKTVRN